MKIRHIVIAGAFGMALYSNHRRRKPFALLDSYKLIPFLGWVVDKQFIDFVCTFPYNILTEIWV